MLLSIVTGIANSLLFAYFFILISEYPGRCFGRGFFDDVGVQEEETVSGHVADCSRGLLILWFTVSVSLQLQEDWSYQLHI